MHDTRRKSRKKIALSLARGQGQCGARRFSSRSRSTVSAGDPHGRIYSKSERTARTDGARRGLCTRAEAQQDDVANGAEVQPDEAASDGEAQAESPLKRIRLWLFGLRASLRAERSEDFAGIGNV